MATTAPTCVPTRGWTVRRILFLLAGTFTLGATPPTEEVMEAMSPKWIAPIVVWLASVESSRVTGRVFDVMGDLLAVAEGWHRGPKVTQTQDPSDIGPLVEQLMAEARPNADMMGADRA